MADPVFLGTREVALDAIVTGKRLRPVTASAVDAIVASMATVGAQIAPVALRETEDGALHLMCGAHRLAAARKMGRETIRADVWRCQDQIARFFEVHENLASAELSTLELAQFLAEAKQAYEDLHPTTKAHISGGLARQGLATDTVSFADALAEKRGVNPRSIRRLTQLGKSLDPAAAEVIRARPKAATVRELAYFTQFGPETQRSIARAWDGVTARTPLEAHRVVKGEAARPPQPKPDERACAALLAAWDKAPMKARRSFLEQLADERQQGPLLRDALAAAEKNRVFETTQALRNDALARMSADVAAARSGPGRPGKAAR